MNEPVTFLDYWRIVWRARIWIGALVLLAVVVALVVGRFVPRVYVSVATALPPRETPSQTMSTSLSAIGALAGQFGGGGINLPGVAISLPSATPAQDLVIAVLKSRRMREEVVRNLQKTWGPDVGSMILDVKPTLKDKVVISLVVEAKDGRLAAEVANHFFKRLDEVLEEYGRRALQRQQVLFTAQLDEAAKEVQAAENALLKFQTEHRVLPSAVLRSAMPSGTGTGGGPGEVAGLRTTIMSLELQREVLRMKYTDQHPQVQEIEKQIAELKRLYSQNLFGTAMELPPERPGVRAPRREFFTPAEKSTEVQFEMQKLLRNLQIQEGFFTAALQGLQQIRYGEGASAGRVEVLDQAVPASSPARPNMVLVVTAAVLASLVAGIFLALFLEYVRQTRAGEQARRRARGTDNGHGDRVRPAAQRVATGEEPVPVSRTDG
jgi:tyrosine-protein kinase Etk/Wzc